MKKESKYNIYERLLVAAISSLVGIAVIFGFIFLAAALCLSADLPEDYSSVISGICAGAGAVSSGFIAAKKLKSNGIINGVICGLMIYAVIFFLSLFISETGFTLVTVFHLLIVIISSAIGGLLGVTASMRKKII